MADHRVSIWRIRHAIQRCKERYQINLTDRDYIKLVRQIETKRARYITTGRVLWKSLWEVMCKGRNLMAVYDESPGIIVTFLPPVGEAHYH